MAQETHEVTSSFSARHQIPGYTITGKIGRGGFSVVYSAIQDHLDRRVALKVLLADFDDPAHARRFRTECRVLGRLSEHPDVVDVYDAGVSPEGVGFIAMRLYSRGTIAQEADRDPLPVERVVEVGQLIGSALQAAHDLGVIHRDVKPENILVGEQGRPAITDFGISALADPSGKMTTSLAFSRSHAAPEVLDANRYGPASDQYSLASTLYALLAGHPAFQEATDFSQARAVLYDPVPPFDRADVPKGLAAAITRGMAKDPSDRYPTMAAFVEALSGAHSPGSLPLQDSVTVLQDDPPSSEKVAEPQRGQSQHWIQPPSGQESRELTEVRVSNSDVIGSANEPRPDATALDSNNGGTEATDDPFSVVSAATATTRPPNQDDLTLIHPITESQVAEGTGAERGSDGVERELNLRRMWLLIAASAAIVVALFGYRLASEGANAKSLVSATSAPAKVPAGATRAPVTAPAADYYVTLGQSVELSTGFPYRCYAEGGDVWLQVQPPGSRTWRNVAIANADEPDPECSDEQVHNPANVSWTPNETGLYLVRWSFGVYGYESDPQLVWVSE